MSNPLSKWIARYNWIARKLRYYCFGSIDQELRSQAVRISKRAVLQLKGASQAFANKSMEAEANDAFTLATMLQSTQCLLQVWESFLAGKHHEAWHHLIDGQDAARAAMSYSPLGRDCESQLHRLFDLERHLFPWQAYFSPALVILEERCSICGDVLEDCEHLPGKLYMGSPCRGRVTKFNAVGASIVTTPADKRCYSRNFPAHQGRSRECFSGKLLQGEAISTMRSAILLVSTYMRDFDITDEVLARSFAGHVHSPQREIHIPTPSES